MGLTKSGKDAHDSFYGLHEIESIVRQEIIRIGFPGKILITVHHDGRVPGKCEVEPQYKLKKISAS